MRFTKTNIRRSAAAAMLALILLLWLGPLAFRANASQLPGRELKISDSSINATATYKFSFDVVSSSNIGSILFQFCSNTPLVDEPCTPAPGPDLSAAVLTGQTGETGFTKYTGVGLPTNVILLTRPTTSAVPGFASYEFGNVVNSPNRGSFYVRVETFASDNGSGPHTDYGGIAYSIDMPVQVSVKVPPYLLFCDGLVISGYDCSTASGSYINFGELSANQAKTGTTDIVVATNAKFGYSLSVYGTTMQSGVHAISAISGLDVSRPGTSQFGLNLVGNADPNVGDDPQGPGAGVPTADYSAPNRYKFVSGDTIASSSGADAYRKYTVSYIVNVPSGQSPGIYVSTLTYIALATF